jgi:RimJ/RimL family protein N-acetyltransferase
MSLTFPTLLTSRLVLRGPREDDFESHARFMASPRAAMVGGPQDRWQSWRGFLGILGHWALRGYGFWTITLKDDCTPIGKTGFIFQDGWLEPELGWQLYDGYESRGYATEAARAAREAGPRLFGLDNVISYIDPANERSRRLAIRLGARLEGDGTLLGKPAQIWRHPALAEAA